MKIKHCIMDGGITPYQLPWMVTRFIALKDYLMMMIGRTGGVALLEKRIYEKQIASDRV